MTGSSFRYLFKEGFRNTWSNRMMSIASICVLMSCLVLIGCASMIFLNIESLLGRIEEENVVMVYIQDDTSDADIAAMDTQLKGLDNVKEVEFVPKEDAWADQLSTMEEAQAQFFTEISSDIPLPDAFKVTVDDLTYFDQTVSQIEQLDHIDTIRENKDLAEKLVTIRHGVEVISIVIVAVLLAISVFIISNTIKLTVYSRRLEISIMKSVGATNSFVRLPFVVEGLLLGLVSAVVAFFVIWGAYTGLVHLITGESSSLWLRMMFQSVVPFRDVAWQLGLSFAGAGMVTGAIGSAFCISSHLKV